MDVDLVDLERSIKAIPGVLGCVILANEDGTAAEIQAFTRMGADQEAIRRGVLDQVEQRGLAESLNEIHVFELEAESEFGDRESLERAVAVAEQEARTRGPSGQEILSQLERSLEDTPRSSHRGGAPRPALKKVSLTSSHWTSEAEVALGEDASFVGRASGDKTPHGLKVLGQATLEAVNKLMDNALFTFEGASLVSILGREAVLVLVRWEDLETVGAALVRKGPVTEAAVRATLDAVNRRLEQR